MNSPVLAFCYALTLLTFAIVAIQVMIVAV